MIDDQQPLPSFSFLHFITNILPSPAFPFFHGTTLSAVTWDSFYIPVDIPGCHTYAFLLPLWDRPAFVEEESQHWSVQTISFSFPLVDPQAFLLLSSSCFELADFSVKHHAGLLPLALALAVTTRKSEGKKVRENTPHWFYSMFWFVFPLFFCVTPQGEHAKCTHRMARPRIELTIFLLLALTTMSPWAYADIVQFKEKYHFSQCIMIWAFIHYSAGCF